MGGSSAPPGRGGGAPPTFTPARYAPRGGGGGSLAFLSRLSPAPDRVARGDHGRGTVNGAGARPPRMATRSRAYRPGRRRFRLAEVTPARRTCACGHGLGSGTV